MKLAPKLVLTILLLLGILLAAGGGWLLKTDFERNFDQARTRNILAHRRDTYSLQNGLLVKVSDGMLSRQAVVDYGESLGRYVGQEEDGFAVYQNEESLYSSLPGALEEQEVLRAIEAGEEALLLQKAGESSYMLMASGVQVAGEEYWLVSAYDVTGVFQAREDKFQELFRLELAALALAGAAAALAVSWMIRPLKKLEKASRAVAAGDYTLSTATKSRDEVGALSRSFDAMTATVRDKVDQMEDTIQRQKQFVSAFTHELKTPMTSILGYSDLLRSGEMDPEDQRQAVQYIHREALRLETLSGKLLQLMGLVEQEELTLEPVRLALVLRDMAASLPELAPMLEIRCDPALTVLADRDLLADLVRNLVVNAARAQPKDGRVHITAGRTENGIVLRVADRGRGIPEADLPHITEPFYMVDKSRARAQNGSGMGLALCARIARLHGSELHFTSKLGQGTVVELNLQEGTV
ncbi:HAMP domain-containing sensor histidine kinase [Fournierella sp.]|uniref:sensor histidine kinase n=1 Tax=Allofournierella sp. TaxID=1940256 RepID=UPI0025BD9415|nr:HAMP domain-containing sensor histidine kinase [Fournierella sp.]